MISSKFFGQLEQIVNDSEFVFSDTGAWIHSKVNFKNWCNGKKGFKYIPVSELQFNLDAASSFYRQLMKVNFNLTPKVLEELSFFAKKLRGKLRYLNNRDSVSSNNSSHKHISLQNNRKNVGNKKGDFFGSRFSSDESVYNGNQRLFSDLVFDLVKISKRGNKKVYDVSEDSRFKFIYKRVLGAASCSGIKVNYNEDLFLPVDRKTDEELISSAIYESVVNGSFVRVFTGDSDLRRILMKSQEFLPSSVFSNCNLEIYLCRSTGIYVDVKISDGVIIDGHKDFVNSKYGLIDSSFPVNYGDSKVVINDG